MQTSLLSRIPTAHYLHKTVVCVRPRKNNRPLVDPVKLLHRGKSAKPQEIVF